MTQTDHSSVYIVAIDSTSHKLYCNIALFRLACFPSYEVTGEHHRGHQIYLQLNHFQSVLDCQHV